VRAVASCVGFVRTPNQCCSRKLGMPDVNKMKELADKFEIEFLPPQT